MLDLNKIYCGDNLTLIKQLDDGCIDLTVTSPPYDNLERITGLHGTLKDRQRALPRYERRWCSRG